MKAGSLPILFITICLAISTTTCNYIGITNRTSSGFAAIWALNSNSSAIAQVHTAAYDSNRNVIQNDTLIDEDTDQALVAPTKIVGTSDGGQIALWVQRSQKGSYPMIQLFDSEFKPKGDPIDVSSSVATYQTKPDIAVFSDDSFVVAFNDGSDEDSNLYFQIFDKNGTMVGAPVQISQDQAQHPSVATLSNDDFVMSWDINSKTSVDIYYQRFDSKGNSKFEITLLNTSIPLSSDPIIAGLVDGGYVIAFVGIADLDKHCYNGYFARFSFLNKQIGGVTQVNSELPCPMGLNLDLTAMFDGGFIVSWNEISHDSYFYVYSQRYSVASTKVGQSIDLDEGDDQMRTSVTGLNNDNYVVFWVLSNIDDNSHEGYAQEFNSLNQKVGDQITVIKTSEQQVIE